MNRTMRADATGPTGLSGLHLVHSWGLKYVLEPGRVGMVWLIA